MSGISNEDLRFLLGTGTIYSKRSLIYIIEDKPVSYTTEYLMHGKEDDFAWYTTWAHPVCNDPELLWKASILYPSMMARARFYFPAFLNQRIPPANREEPQLSQILKSFGMDTYNKFTLICRSGGVTPITKGYVEEIDPIDCDRESIHAIEEIVMRYNGKTEDEIYGVAGADEIDWALPGESY